MPDGRTGKPVCVHRANATQLVLCAAPLLSDVKPLAKGA